MGEQNKKYLIFDLDEVILDVMKEFDGNKENYQTRKWLI